MQDLRLIAFDAQDLAILSAHLQDAVVRVGDIVYLPREKRFAAVLNRFDWAGAAVGPAGSKEAYQRRRAGLRFERVLGAQLLGIDRARTDQVLALLAIAHEPHGEAPAADIVLQFSGGAAIRLHVECVEAELKDLGAAWRAKGKPRHTEDDGRA